MKAKSISLLLILGLLLLPAFLFAQDTISYVGLKNEYRLNETISFKIKADSDIIYKIYLLYHDTRKDTWSLAWPDICCSHVGKFKKQILKKGDLIEIKWNPYALQDDFIERNHKLPKGNYKLCIEWSYNPSNAYRNSYTHGFILK